MRFDTCRITGRWVQDRTFRVLFLLVVCFFSFFIHNRLIYADIMESRNLVTAREIVAEGNWLVPRMNGALRLEKPPFPTWVAAVVEYWFPDRLAVQRIPAGLMGVMLVFFFYGLVGLLSGDRLLGWVSALLLTTSFSVMLMGRTATWDIYCHSFMMGALFLIVKGGLRQERGWWEFAGAGIFLGLSFLSKGPVAFYALLLPFWLAWLLFRPRQLYLRRQTGPLVLMVGICLLVSFWWPLLLYFRYPEMAVAAWNKESVAWVERNVRPWYYYWKFFVESGIWSGVLLTALFWPYWKKRLAGDRLYSFAWGWMVAIWICLSLLPEKKTRYLLPVLIPSAWAMACVIVCWIRRAKTGLGYTDRFLFRANTLLIAGLAAVLPVGMYMLMYRPGYMSGGCLLASALLCGGIAVWLFRSARYCRPWGFLLGTIALLFTVEVLAAPCAAGFFNNPGIHSIRAVRELAGVRNIPFYQDVKEELRIEIIYEAGRKILPYDFSESLPELPFILVSRTEAGKILTEHLSGGIVLKPLGLFDDNKRPPGTRWHSAKFVHWVTRVEAPLMKNDDKSVDVILPSVTYRLTVE